MSAPLPADPFPVDFSSAAVQVTPGRAREILRASRADFLALLGCNLVVFASSVCIMVLELAASRLIASHKGQSLYTWTSVIGVVLAGISAGNFLGGYLADRYPPQRVLAWSFVASGLLTLNVLVVNYWASGTEPFTWMPWPMWVMWVVAWIFFVPAVALGTISPVTASIALKRSQKTGLTVGNIYAWGALGSIAGTFLAGFVLIDLFGTRAIIVLTAGALLVLALLVAAGQWALRAGVFFGGLPLVVAMGLFTAATGEKTAHAVTSLRYMAGVEDTPKAAQVLASWHQWGRQLGKNLHDLGMTLRLRNDDPRDYHDESNYSEISVAPYRDYETGEQFQALVLDALHHSYYDPNDSTRLYYDYEQIYAAITERASNRWDRSTSVRLRLPVPPGFTDLLPPGTTYDPATRTLHARGAVGIRQLKDLVDVGPGGKYRAALLQAFQDSRARQGQASQTPLESMPEGVEIPVGMAGQIRYDTFFRQIHCEKPLPLADMFRLMEPGEDGTYAQEVAALFRASRRVRAFFVGGGGFIFPRWIEALFPDRPRIDVAEIDPAVLDAVEKHMGLPVRDRAEMDEPADTEGQRSVQADVADAAELHPPPTYVRTHLGDARKIVDDRLHKNAALAKAGRSPVQYDFIYGDAFNHYSVPWHLTTEEFNRKIRDLLDPREGVYLVNIIDEFPRAEHPAASEQAGRGGAMCLGPPPQAVVPHGLAMDSQWLPAPHPFEALQVRWKEIDQYELYSDRPLTETERDDLMNLTLDREQTPLPRYLPFREAVLLTFQAARERRTHEGPIPAALIPPGLAPNVWTASPEPHAFVEVQQREPRGFLIGFRGIMNDSQRAALQGLAPGDAEWANVVAHLHSESRRPQSGQFLARYVNTVRQVFPYVYVFTANREGTSESRDTFVVACAIRRQDFQNLLEAGNYWPGGPFAWTEADAQGDPRDFGQMPALLDRARGLTLTDDYAPVDNLLAPLFEKDD